MRVLIPGVEKMSAGDVVVRDGRYGYAFEGGGLWR